MASKRTTVAESTKLSAVKLTTDRGYDQLANKSQYRDITISRQYTKYFGDRLTISINGYPVMIPCDGRAHSVPGPYADEAAQRMLAVDELDERTDKMADISKNFEAAPGVLEF